MKKIIALFLLAALMTATVLGAAGCSRDENDKGATLLMWLAPNTYTVDLDPAKLIYTAESVKYFALLYEGLTVMDDKGRLEKGMAEKWAVIEDEENGVFRMVFTIKETRWSDGKAVTANDFVYAWKRILEPEFNSPAAAMLYPIRNARAVKEGDMTVDDLGLYADDIRELRIEFERKINYDKFLETLASPYLVPLRDDTVDGTPDSDNGQQQWARGRTGGELGSIGSTLLSNGPFAIKQLEYDTGTTMFDRSTYYLLPERSTDIFKHVTPFRITMNYKDSLASKVQAYEENDFIFFLGSVPRDKFAEYESKAVIKDLLSSYCYYFNADHPLFKDPRVRQALSVALDRNEIAKIAGLGVKPATGIVPHGVIDVKATDSFRAVRGDAISASGKIDEAKKLLSDAKVTGGSFTLTIRGGNDAEKEVAEYAAGVWKQLGFTVTIYTLNHRIYIGDYILKKTEQRDIIEKEAVDENGETITVEETIITMVRQYDVIGYDMQAPGVDAFSVLAPFAKAFSGNVVEFIDEGRSIVNPYITGFQNDDYDKLIEAIYLMDDDYVKRNEELFKAEKMLAELSPIAPLYFNVSLNISKEITGLTYTKFGATRFTKANLKNYHKYSTEEITEED
jgi:oligopeptide transport system substrate-binding protein